MVKDLDDLLPADHLLNIAVHIAERGLLGRIEPGAAPGAVPDIEEHRRIAQHHNQRKLPVEHKQHRQGAGHLDKALDGHRKAVVQRIGHRVHIVCEIAHDVAMALGVKKAQRQGLDMAEQVAPDVIKHLLGGPHHRLGIAERRQSADGVDRRRGRDAAPEPRQIPPAHAVDNRPDHIGAEQVGRRADGNQHRHNQEQELVPPHVGQQRFEGKAKVFRLFTRQRHLRSPLCAVNGRFPGRSGRRRAAPHGCRPRGSARLPAPR